MEGVQLVQHWIQHVDGDSSVGKDSATWEHESLLVSESHRGGLEKPIICKCLFNTPAYVTLVSVPLLQGHETPGLFVVQGLSTHWETASFLSADH